MQINKAFLEEDWVGTKDDFYDAWYEVKTKTEYVKPDYHVRLPYSEDKDDDPLPDESLNH